MTAASDRDEPKAAGRRTRWLPALERELKSRVGWVDEAVSPFAGVKAPARTPVQREPLGTDKAA
jgi:hypothetical protein